MKSRNLIIAIALMMISMPSMLLPVHADNSMIPSSLLSFRDSLLGERQDLLANRSDATARLTALETARRQCDVYLASNLPKDDHDRLVAARGVASERINDLKGWLEAIQSDLISVNDDLRECEARINRWACLK